MIEKIKRYRLEIIIFVFVLGIFATLFFPVQSEEGVRLSRLYKQKERIEIIKNDVGSLINLSKEQDEEDLSNIFHDLLDEVYDIEKRIEEKIKQIDTTLIRVPLIDNSLSEKIEKKESDIEHTECNNEVFYIEREVLKTQMPLDTTYEKLFKMDDFVFYNGERYLNPVNHYTKEKNRENYISIDFEKVVIEGDFATVYLSGENNLKEYCHYLKLTTVIKAAASQFEEIKKVEIYLNNKPLSFEN